MSVLTHDHNAYLVRDDAPQAAAPGAASHIATIKRFVKFTLSLVLIATVVAAVMAVRVVAWFPHVHQ